jgi:sirohydrochlorin ferrochelatase
MKRFCVLTIVMMTAALSLNAAGRQPAAGVLLLAHGGSASWNANVQTIAEAVNRTQPTEVALGMATRANIQAAIDRLEARGVTRIVAVPLFVSSHSSVITSTEYLLGLRADMPAALKIFATMSHGADGAHGANTDASAHHTEDGTVPVRHSVPIRMTRALDAHPIVSSIIASRASEISEEPVSESVVLVAHGPTADDVNEQWLVHLRTVASVVAGDRPYASVDALTVRDDAPAPVRDEATRALREIVERRTAQGRRVLVVPVLLSYGGIEAGIRKRIEGLTWVMSRAALAPDSRLVDWVKAMAQ